MSFLQGVQLSNPSAGEYGSDSIATVGMIQMMQTQLEEKFQRDLESQREHLKKVERKCNLILESAVGEVENLTIELEEERDARQKSEEKFMKCIENLEQKIAHLTAQLLKVEVKTGSFGESATMETPTPATKQTVAVMGSSSHQQEFAPPEHLAVAQGSEFGRNDDGWLPQPGMVVEIKQEPKSPQYQVWDYRPESGEPPHLSSAVGQIPIPIPTNPDGPNQTIHHPYEDKGAFGMESDSNMNVSDSSVRGTPLPFQEVGKEPSPLASPSGNPAPSSPRHSLLKKERREDGKYKFYCKCGWTFSSKYNLNRHIQSDHSVVRHRRNKNEEEKGSIHGLGEEQLGEDGRPRFLCKCGSSYVLQDNLMRHIRTLSSGNGSVFKCHLCPFTYRNYYCLKCHVRQAHQLDGWGEGKVACSNCGTAFDSYKLLHQHRSSVHPYQ